MRISGFKDTWSVSSDHEAGDGYSDILAEIDEEGTAVLIEVKSPEHGNLDKGCREALAQIDKH